MPIIVDGEMAGRATPKFDDGSSIESACDETVGAHELDGNASG